jgi:uncharacterized protein
MQSRLETLIVEVGKDRLSAALLTPATSLPGVLFVHGWGDSKEHDLMRAREMAGLGCACLTFDMRGHAGNAAQRQTVTREENLHDLLAVYDSFVAGGTVDSQSIAVVGISYGGYLAAILTSLRPVRWLALRAPAIYKDAGWDVPKRKLHLDPDFAAYRRRELPAHANRALRACSNYDGDVLVIESEHDEVVPHPVIASYVAAFGRAHSLTARMIEGADHALSDRASQRTYTLMLVKWLTEMIIGARADAAPTPKSPRPPPASKDVEDE